MSMPSSSTAAATPLTTLFEHAGRLLQANHLLGWTDQIVVSGTSFLLMVIIGRWAGPAELGAYAIGLSVLALLIATQESLITRPYAVRLHRPIGSSEDFAFSSLTLSVLLAVVAAIVAVLIGLIIAAAGADRRPTDIAFALACVAPFVLVREFARRFSFANLVIFQALLLDCFVAALSIVAIANLAWFGWFSATYAFAVIGFACFVGGAGWLYLARKSFSWSLRSFKPALRQSWQIGMWFLLSQLAKQAQSYVTAWLALVMAGVATAGIYAACASIVAFANPVLFGFFNVLLPKYVHALQKRGAVALRHQAFVDVVVLTAIMSAFSLVVFIFGDDIMLLLYKGDAYTGYKSVLTVLALASLAGAAGAPASIALAALERPRLVAYVAALTAVLTVALVAALFPNWGLLGAAYGTLIAELVGCIGQWTAFLMLTRKAGPVTSHGISAGVREVGSCPRP